MNTSMKYLFVVAVVAGLFEALSAVWLNAPEVAGQITAGMFAVGLLACAWAIRSRQSVAAATVIAALLFIDVAGIPFYAKTSIADWIMQVGFGAVGIVGLAAWVQVIRHRRRQVAQQ